MSIILKIGVIVVIAPKFVAQATQESNEQVLTMGEVDINATAVNTTLNGTRVSAVAFAGPNLSNSESADHI